MQAGKQIAQTPIGRASSRDLVVEAIRRMRSGDAEIIVICRDSGPMVGILIDPDIAVRAFAEDIPANTTGIVLGGKHFVVRCD